MKKLNLLEASLETLFVSVIVKANIIKNFIALFFQQLDQPIVLLISVVISLE